MENKNAIAGKPHAGNRHGNYMRAVITCVAVVLTAVPAFSMSQEASKRFVEQITYLNAFKNSLTPAQQKVCPEILLAVRAERDENVRRNLSVLMSDSLRERFEGETVDCDITAEVLDELLSRIERLGGIVKSSSSRFKAIHAELPKEVMEKLAEDTAVKSIDPVVAPECNRVNVSEGVVAHRVNAVHELYGFSGRGVKVGVMSDSIRHYIDGFDERLSPLGKWRPALPETEAERRKYTIYGFPSLAPAIWRDMSEVPEDDRKKYRFFKGVMEMR